MEYLTLHDIPHRHFYNPRRMRSPDASRAEPQLPVMAQNHHIRNSPPFQPGEQRQSNALPSFSQLMQNVRDPTPPRTPSRTNRSPETSPVSQTHFGEVSWNDSKRRRFDHSSDAHGSIFPDSRQREPVFRSTAGSRDSRYDHHRPSMPYAARTPPPPTALPIHSRPHSASVGHAPYQYPNGQYPADAVIPVFYNHPLPHQTPTYDQRRSSYYHPEAHPQDRHDSLLYPGPHGHRMGPPLHPEYAPGSFSSGGGSFSLPPPQYQYTFHPALGADQGPYPTRKRRGNLPKEATSILKDWFNAHLDSPYPPEEQKNLFCRQTGLTPNQVSNWFINARRRAPGKVGRERPPTAEE